MFAPQYALTRTSVCMIALQQWKISDSVLDWHLTTGIWYGSLCPHKLIILVKLKICMFYITFHVLRGVEARGWDYFVRIAVRSFPIFNQNKIEKITKTIFLFLIRLTLSVTYRKKIQWTLKLWSLQLWLTTWLPPRTGKKLKES